jgi:hypothetical protein
MILLINYFTYKSKKVDKNLQAEKLERKTVISKVVINKVIISIVVSNFHKFYLRNFLNISLCFLSFGLSLWCSNVITNAAITVRLDESKILHGGGQSTKLLKNFLRPLMGSYLEMNRHF